MKFNNPTSFVSYKIIILDFIKNNDPEDCDNQIATATGFLYKRNGLAYLITNWHVVNERDFWEKKEKRSERHPTHVLFTPSFSTSDTRVVKDTRAIKLALYDDFGNPQWLVHPKWKNDIDIVAIPIPPTMNFGENKYEDLLAINELYSTVQLDLSVTDELFVIGYPYGLGSDQKGTLPIWKKSTVASEPEMPYLRNGQPTFLIDGITNPSMSGSPVIRHLKGTVNTNNGILLGASGIILAGVYSGRISSQIEGLQKCKLDFSKIIEELNKNDCMDFKYWFVYILRALQNIIRNFVLKVVHHEIENDTQIGLVWKASLIDEIIDGKEKDKIIYDSDFYGVDND